MIFQDRTPKMAAEPVKEIEKEQVVETTCGSHEKTSMDNF